MPVYSDYLCQTLARVGEEEQWYAGQADAAALCFDIFAFFPDRQGKILLNEFILFFVF